jgi:hypothetical protein
VICFETYSIFFLVFSNSPCRETPKNALKKKREKKKVRTFFCELAQMYVVFSFYFFGRPLAEATVAEATAKVAMQAKWGRRGGGLSNSEQGAPRGARGGGGGDVSK